MILRNKNKFFLEIFTPKYKKVYMGKVLQFEGHKVFMTHIKIPEKHFYIKGNGYPVNQELLKMLPSIGVHVVATPVDDGSGDITIYLAPVKEYLRPGNLIKEPWTERQHCIDINLMRQV